MIKSDFNVRPRFPLQSSLPGVMILAVFISQQMLAPLLVPLGRAAGFTDSAMAAIMSGASVFFVAGSLFWGRHASSRGLGATLRLGFAGAIIGLLVFAVALSLAIANAVPDGFGLALAFIGRSMLFGFMASAVPVAAQSTALAMETDADRTKAVSSVGLAYSLAGIVGPALGSVLIAASPFAPLWSAPVIMLIATSLVLAARRTLLSARASADSKHQATQAEKSDGVDKPRWIPRRALVRLCVGVLLWFGSNTVVVLCAFFMLDVFGLSVADSGVFVGVTLTLTSICAVLTQVFVTRRWRRSSESLMLMGLCVLMTGAIALLVASTPYLFAVGVVCNGVGGAMTLPGFTLWIGQSVPRRLQPQLAGAMEASSSVAAALVPIIGVLLFNLDSVTPLALVASCFLIAAGWVIVARRRR